MLSIFRNFNSNKKLSLQTKPVVELYLEQPNLLLSAFHVVRGREDIEDEDVIDDVTVTAAATQMTHQVTILGIDVVATDVVEDVRFVTTNAISSIWLLALSSSEG